MRTASAMLIWDFRPRETFSAGGGAVATCDTALAVGFVIDELKRDVSCWLRGGAVAVGGLDLQYI